MSISDTYRKQIEHKVLRLLQGRALSAGEIHQAIFGRITQRDSLKDQVEDQQVNQPLLRSVLEMMVWKGSLRIDVVGGYQLYSFAR